MKTYKTHEEWFKQYKQDNSEADNIELNHEHWCVTKDAWIAALESLPKKPERHSDQLRKWYFACVCGEPAKYSGHSKEEIHEFHKYKFLLYPHKKYLTIQGADEVASTKKMTNKEYIEWITEKLIPYWSTEHDVYIPMPNEVEMFHSLSLVIDK